jgi:hypothetical protein
MTDRYELIRDRLIARGLRQREAETIIGFVRKIEEGVRSINHANMNTEPEFVFIAATTELI